VEVASGLCVGLVGRDRSRSFEESGQIWWGAIGLSLDFL
jgi:hypothetical protein